MTQNARPAVRIVIPTHNRRESVRRALDALREQEYPMDRLEVVVVIDGSADGTAEALGRYEAPFGLRVIEQPALGPAVARNRGAAGAVRQLLIFMDDDIEPTPPWVGAHVRSHQRQPGGVVIGYLPPMLQEQHGLFRAALRRWWEEMFAAMRAPGHRFAYSDLLSGNFSLPTELFARIGGFDPALRCHEDYELGLRLLHQGVPFSFAPDALGHHHERTDLEHCLARKEQEGQADVQLGHRHPELRPVLLMTRLLAAQTPQSRLLRRLAFAAPAVGDRTAYGLRRALDLLEAARARGRWSRLLDHLMAYWYWRGVARELGTEAEVIRFLSKAAPVEEKDVVPDLDLNEGIRTAEQWLDETRPHGVCLWYGPHSIGMIPPQPGAERLRGSHLRPALVDRLAAPLLAAMRVEGALWAPSVVSARQGSSSDASLDPALSPGRRPWIEAHRRLQRTVLPESAIPALRCPGIDDSAVVRGTER